MRISDWSSDVCSSDLKQTLELPEQVSAQYLLLNEAAAMQNLPAVSNDDLHKYYEQNKARFVQPARVNLSHIQVNVAAGASDQERKQAHAKAEEILKKVQADKSDRKSTRLNSSH